MAYSSNVLPELFSWNIDNKPIAVPTDIVVPAGSTIMCAFASEGSPAIPASYQLLLKAQEGVGSWQIQVSLLSDSRVDVIISAEAVESEWIKDIPMVHSGAIKSYTVSFKNTSAVDRKLLAIEMRPSIALDAQTAEAIEQVLPSVQVFQSTDPINFTGASVRYGFEVTTTRSTSLIAHVLLTVAANASGLGTATVLYNGIVNLIGTMYFPITDKRITTTLVVPLMSIPDGNTLVEIEFSGDAPFVIPSKGLVVSVDGKYLSSRGSTNPTITAADVIAPEYGAYASMDVKDTAPAFVVQKPIQIVVNDTIAYTPNTYAKSDLVDTIDLTRTQINSN